MSERPLVRYVSLGAAALALVAMGLALWDLVLERGAPRDSIRILLLAAAVLFVAITSLGRGDRPSGDR